MGLFINSLTRRAILAHGCSTSPEFNQIHPGPTEISSILFYNNRTRLPATMTLNIIAIIGNKLPEIYVVLFVEMIGEMCCFPGLETPA